MSSRVVIIDEGAFSKVCAALFEVDGVYAEIEASVPVNGDAGLIVTSYPFAQQFHERLEQSRIPTIVLIDCAHRELADAFARCANFCCMIKPLDYRKFRRVVREALAGSFRSEGEVLID